MRERDGERGEREGERETDRETDREIIRDRDRHIDLNCVCVGGGRGDNFYSCPMFRQPFELHQYHVTRSCRNENNSSEG